MQVEESLILPVDPDSLWPWISTPDRLAEWITDAQRFEVEPAGELEEGSRLIVHLPRGAPIEGSVERADRGRMLVLRASGLPNDLEVLVTFLVRGQEGGSVLTLRAETQLKGLMVFAETMITSKARTKLKSWADSLRKAIGGSIGR
jgi:carbon monoxide dehydrogenase subunit G